MKIKLAFNCFLFVLFGIALLSCATTPHEEPAIEQINLIGTQWERTNPPIAMYVLIFVDKSNCMYVYPNTVHKRSYTINGNKIIIANDTYDLDGNILYYKGTRYFIKVN